MAPEQIDDAALEQIKARAEAKLAEMRTEIEAINRELRMATDGEFELPPIDALATLQPQILARIIREAITPFYDSSLDRRVYEAREEWEERYPGTGDRCDALWQAISLFSLALERSNTRPEEP